MDHAGSHTDSKMNAQDNCSASRGQSAAVIEIANVRQSFYTATNGAPDPLFAWLVTTARLAYEITSSGGHRLTQTSASQPGVAAERYMASLLLCDNNFIQSHAQKQPYDHLYHLDLSAGTIRLRTQLCDSVQSSASYPSVLIEGRIRENSFVVHNADSDRVLTEISEEDLKKPNFFSQELPLRCPRTQQSGTPPGAVATETMLDQSFELRLPVNLDGNTRMVLISKQKGEQEGKAQDADTGEVICVIPSHYWNNLGLLVENLPAMLTAARSSISPS